MGEKTGVNKSAFAIFEHAIPLIGTNLLHGNILSYHDDSIRLLRVQS